MHLSTIFKLSPVKFETVVVYYNLIQILNLQSVIILLSFREEADLLARALGCRLLQTSVKEDVNVAAVFRHLASRCLAEMREPRDDFYASDPTITTVSPHSLLSISELIPSIATVDVASLLT